MQFRRPGGPNVPLVAALSAIAGSGRLTVTGHSLGAALATYLAADLADPQRLGNRVAARLFASPRPGDGLFAQYAGALIADCRAYAREFDLVPRVPFGFDYAPISSTVMIPLGAGGVRVRLSSGPRGQHHVLSHAAQLDPSCLTPTALLPIDDPYLACLILPQAAAAAA
jgi:triacylglycerol lipase